MGVAFIILFVFANLAFSLKQTSKNILFLENNFLIGHSVWREGG